MGKRAFDRFSLLHFATGIIAYHWSVPLVGWVIANIIFEIVENTITGVLIIRKYMHYWPGGKPAQDGIVNSTMDIISGIVGWWLAHYTDSV